MSVELSYFAASTETSTSSTTARSASDFDVFSITAPSDSRLPDGGACAIGGLYNIKPPLFAPCRQLHHVCERLRETNRALGRLRPDSARPQGGVTLQGGLSSGRTTIDELRVAASCPRSSTGFLC